MKRGCLLLLLLFSVYACQPKVNSDTLRQRAEFLHDSIMPQSGELMRLKRDCQQKAVMFEEISPALADSFRNHALALDAAYQAMMDWMHAYAVPDETTSEEVSMAYFEDQIRSITAVGNAYQQSMENARNIIQLHEDK